MFNRKSAGSIVKQSVKTWYDGAAKVYDYSNGNPDQVSLYLEEVLISRSRFVVS